MKMRFCPYCGKSYNKEDSRCDCGLLLSDNIKKTTQTYLTLEEMNNGNYPIEDIGIRFNNADELLESKRK